jgi:hypothetical protein
MKYCRTCNKPTTELIDVPQWATAQVCLACYVILQQAVDDGWEAAKAEYRAARGRMVNQ